MGIAARRRLAFLVAAVLSCPGLALAQEAFAPPILPEPSFLGDPYPDTVEDVPLESPPAARLGVPDPQVTADPLDAFGPYGPPPSEPPAPIDSSRAWVTHGLWYTQQEFVFLNRARDEKIWLTVRQTDDVFLSTDAAPLKAAPGARLTLGRYLGRDDVGRDYNLQFTFLGLFDWESSAFLQTNFGTQNQLRFLPEIGLPGFDAVNRHEFFYDSSFNSFELNGLRSERVGPDRMVLAPNGAWIRELNGGWVHTYLVGLRYMRLSENFDFLSIGADPDARRGEIHTDTQNDMIGPQIGMDFSGQTNWIRYGVLGKIGPMINIADQRTRLEVIAPAGIAPREVFASDEVLAFLLETRIHAQYFLTPHARLLASWDLLFVNGVALAPYQFEPPMSETGIVQAGNHFLATGVAFGFELDW